MKEIIRYGGWMAERKEVKKEGKKERWRKGRNEQIVTGGYRKTNSNANL